MCAGRVGNRCRSPGVGVQSGHSRLVVTVLVPDGVAFHADGNGVAHGLAAAEHVIEPALTGAHHDRSCGARGRIIYDLAADDAIDDAEGCGQRPHLAGVLARPAHSKTARMPALYRR